MSDVKIFAKTIEPEAVFQINTIAKHPVFKNSKIRIMPDAHAGKGCVIGFTAKPMEGTVIPSLVGVDIACGMLTVKLNPDIVINEEELKKLDDVIRNYVPAGRNVHEEEQVFNLHNLQCKDQLKNKSHIKRSIGTLGGGNHFIELAESNKGGYYLIIHTGSRNLGKQVCDIYQQKAYDRHFGKDVLKGEIDKVISDLKAAGRESEIEVELKKLKASFVGHFVDMPRAAPHGAGRLFSRSEARKQITLNEYQKSMEGIFTTSVCRDTIDESPFAYKDAKEIEEAVSDTVTVTAHLKSVYNFKASE